MAMTLLVLALAATAMLWLAAQARPQPVKVRRNLTPEEIAEARRQSGIS